MKKYVAEFIGTCVLVTFGCGTAMLVGCNAAAGSGYLLTALAFGLVIVAMAYSIGNISGCHINPAVSLGLLVSGRMKSGEFVAYCIAQCLGALAGAFLLLGIFSLGGVKDMTAAAADKVNGLGTNGLAGVGGSAVAGILVEVVLTFVFVLTILGVTSSKAGHGSFGGSCHRPHTCTYPHRGHRPYRHERQSRQVHRTRYRSCHRRQYGCSGCCVGIHRRSFYRRRRSRMLLQVSGKLILCLRSDWTGDF